VTRAVRAGAVQEKSRKPLPRVWAVAMYSSAPNKANFPCFGPENEGGRKSKANLRGRSPGEAAGWRKGRGLQ